MMLSITISVEFEPVEPDAARQHELNGSERGGERDEAGPVEADLDEPLVGGSVRAMPMVAAMPTGISM